LLQVCEREVDGGYSGAGSGVRSSLRTKSAPGESLSGKPIKAAFWANAAWTVRNTGFAWTTSAFSTMFRIRPSRFWRS
jgi:hypothetical protein